MEPTLRNYRQDLNRGVLTLQASIILPEEAAGKELQFLSFCTLVFATVSAYYAASVDKLTFDHDDLKEPKSPIDLQAEFVWGSITGNLELGAHLCAAGTGILSGRFTEQVPAQINEQIEEFLETMKAQRQADRLRAAGITVVGI